MLQIPAPCYVPCQLLQGARRDAVEAFGFLSDEALEPDIAEIHEFAILNVPKIRRIRENCVQARQRQSGGCRASAADVHASRSLAVKTLADPLALDGNLFFGAIAASDLERFVAVALGLRVFVDDIAPPSRANTKTVAVLNPEEIAFTLQEAHG